MPQINWNDHKIKERCQNVFKKCQKIVRLAWECKKAIFSNSTMIKICVCWTQNLDQMQSNWIFLFLVLTIQLLDPAIQILVVFMNPSFGSSDPNIGSIHESKFWIACSNYRLNHPMYGLLEHKTEVVFL